jgi:hypothetical protein
MAEKEDLPWWTDGELEQAGEEFEIYLRDHPESVTISQDVEQASTYTGSDIKYIYFSRGVLDKYRDNKYCHIGFDDGHGHEFIRFLSVDPSKPPDSGVRFLSGISNMNKHFVNIPDDPNILAVRTQDYTNIPPRQRHHWDQYEIPESQLHLVSR